MRQPDCSCWEAREDVFLCTVSTPSFSQPFCADCLKRTLDRILKLTSDWRRSTQWEMTCTDAVSAAESKIRALQNRTLLVMSSPLGRLSGAHQSLSLTLGTLFLTLFLYLLSMYLLHCFSQWCVSVYLLSLFTVEKVKFISICFSPRNRNIFHHLFKSSISKGGQPQFYFCLFL